jgi:N6-L-threonylcarbamoyladenine synthase
MPIILAIESSCDDTAAAVMQDGCIKSNVVASQKVHQDLGGVVPEMASREHMQNISLVVDDALQKAQINKKDIDAIAFTQAPGLIGSLMVGAGFAKSLAHALNVPLIGVHHMQAHIMAHFIDDPKPQFPFLCLTVSGGHTQLVLCHSANEFDIVGTTIDDAAGEAFDKIAKLLGLPYPGGPLIDKYAVGGNIKAFAFPITHLADFKMSFSGIKTAVMYFLDKQKQIDPSFVDNNLSDLCASIQHTIVEMLLAPMKKCIKKYKVKHIGIAGGVSANSYLRKRFEELGQSLQCQTYIPAFQYCTDNAAMIAMVGHFKYLDNHFSSLDIEPKARMDWH